MVKYIVVRKYNQSLIPISSFSDKEKAERYMEVVHIEKPFVELEIKEVE